MHWLVVEADEEIARLWHQEMVTGGSSYSLPETWVPMQPEAAQLLEDSLESMVLDGAIERATKFTHTLMGGWLGLCAGRRLERERKQELVATVAETRPATGEGRGAGAAAADGGGGGGGGGTSAL